MTDVRTIDGEEDRLPWLEAVESEDEPQGPGIAKLIVAVLVGLVAIGLIVGGLFWLGNRQAGGGEAEGGVIAAPEGDYKVRPDAPGGMQVEGEGDTAFAASEGQEPNARLNVEAIPETPVANAQRPAQAPQGTQAPRPAGQAQGQTPQAQRPGQQAQAQPAPRPAPPAARPAQPAQAPAASGPAIQLGAFSSQASASAAWRALSGRFAYLAPLTHNVVPAQVGGRTLYRLRASGPGAADVCRRLTVAGESCVSVG